MTRGSNKQRGKSSHEDDKEFALLLSVAKEIDYIAALETARQKTTEGLKNLTIENAEANNIEIDLSALEQRIKGLFDESERRSRALLRVIDEQGEKRAERILENIERLHIFFSVISQGWKRARRVYGRWQVDRLMKEVRQSCPEEVALYKKAWRDWREARKRYLATENEQDWKWYKSGTGNKNSVAYRTKVDLNRKGGEAHFRSRRLMKYMAHELLSRCNERRRAERDLQVAQALMTKTRQQIYNSLGIPLELV